jgi:guanylate kinase
VSEQTGGAPDTSTADRSELPAHRNPPEVDRVAAAKAAVAARRARAAVKAAIASGERSPLEVAKAAWSEDESVVAATAAERSLRVRDLLTSPVSVRPVPRP